MPRLLNSAAIASTVALLVGGAQTTVAQGFQGVITYRVHSNDGKDAEMTQSTKGKKFRIDFGDKGIGHEGAMVSDGDAQTMMMIDASKKQYTIVTAEEMRKWQEAMAGMMAKYGKMGGEAKEETKEKGGGPKVSVIKTGRTEMVAGFPCEVYTGVSVDEGKAKQGEVCIGKGIGYNPAAMLSGPMGMFMGGGAGGRGRGGAGLPPGMEGLSDALSEGGIVKMTEIENGKRNVVFEATRIQPGNVSDAVFSPPPGYTQQHMPSPDQLKGAMTKP